MTTKYVPKKANAGSVLWDWLQKPENLFGAITTPTTKQVFVGPAGNYSGASMKDLSVADGGIVTNPYGVTSYVSEFLVGPLMTLAPGQSIDVRSGRLSDPNLHAGTAQRLNNQIQGRQVNEAGLSQASEDSARKSPSVLAAMDDLYFANVATSVKTSFELSQLSQAKQGGLNTSGTKTILGTSAPPAPAVKKFEIR